MLIFTEYFIMRFFLFTEMNPLWLTALAAQHTTAGRTTVNRFKPRCCNRFFWNVRSAHKTGQDAAGTAVFFIAMQRSICFG